MVDIFKVVKERGANPFVSLTILNLRYQNSPPITQYRGQR